LALDLFTCSAQGYGTPLDEQFNSTSTPAGWEVVDNVGDGVEWVFNDPGDRGNLTPGGSGGFAIVDSYFGGYYDVDSELRTPVLNLSGQSGLKLRFATDFNIFAVYPPEVADVDVTLNGGGSWTNVFRRTEAQGDFNATVELPLPMLDGQPQAQLRFRYYNAYYDSWWQVDNVKLGVPVAPPVPDFAESFDSPTFPPPDWTILDVDGGAVTWTRSTTNPHSGAGSAWFDDGLSTDPPQEGWLVSPEINIANSGLFLKFFERDVFPTFYFSHTLWVCTADCGSPPDNFTQILEMNNPITGWRSQQVNMNPYVGQTVRFAWRYEGTFADEWFVDDVTISHAGTGLRVRA
jgi:hypothetical protein